MRHGAATAVVVWLAGSIIGCDPVPDAEPSLDLLPVLQRGAFVPAGGWAELAELTADGTAVDWAGESYWLPLPVVPDAGWGRANRLGWRPMGARSTLRLWPRDASSRADRGAAAELVVELNHRRSAEDVASAGAGEVAVFWRGEPLGQLALPPGRSRGRWPVPESLLADVNEVELRFDPPVEQSPQGSQTLALERLGLVAAGEEPAPQRTRFGLDAQRRLLQISGAGHFVAALELPLDAQRLRFDRRWRGPPGTLRLLAIAGDGDRRELLSVDGSAGGEWSAAAASVAALAGHRLLLAFEIAGGGVVEIRAPRLIRSAPVEGGAGTRSPTAASPTAASPTAASSATGSSATGSSTASASLADPVSSAPLPDVVLIILDAARGDRLANPEARRQTTPNIDRMAADALVFRRAYSECPTTSCSIPNLITGLPFLAAGLGRGSWLDDRVQTLAESLRSIGYRTVSFSANPHNSASRNLHQGFDEFRRLWGRRRNHGPYFMSRRAAETIAAQAADEPLFLQLHYLPPHEPYAPLPAFDVFSDPGYRGPIAPRSSPKPYRQSREALTDADVARFVDLYDGNLLMVDDAVARVFTALESAGRWHNSIVLITSDHGEAFWEHGEQGHNSTLFDEMLHVPFILRLPPGYRPQGVDTDRLATLGDVVPTLLGRLGLKPDPGVAGIDLLAAAPEGERPRRVFHRTNNPTLSTWSVRTPRFKVIVRPRFQEQWLFDLADDPGELRNLVGDRPILYAGLSLLLRQHLAEISAVDLETAQVPLSEEEQEVLRSLGYL